MSDTASRVLRVTGLRKDYGGLRPLRLQSLRLGSGDRAAIVGVDADAAEVLVNLLTGATLADEGTIEIFGGDTSAIADADDWLRTLDRFGVLSVRAVLVDALTVAQNLAMAYTLSVDPVPGDVMRKVDALAAKAGLSADALARPLADAAPGVRARCHWGRALALEPAIVILEHANALVAPDEVETFGGDIARVAESDGIALLALTADEAFARAVARHVYRLDAASGRLVAASGWRRWFS